MRAGTRGAVGSAVRKRLLVHLLATAMVWTAARHATARELSAGDMELLERHMPVLIIHPQDPARKRPGSGVLRGPGKKGFADYHPIALEEIASRATARERVSGWRGWLEVARSINPFTWKPLQPTGLAEIQRIAATQKTDNMELDLAPVRESSGRHMWSYYSKELEGPRGAGLRRAVIHGDVVRKGGATTLVYDLAYFGNDHINKHGGDHEIVAVRLGADGQPVELGVSAHSGGNRLEWQHARVEDGRPVVYVGRGSHGMYLAHEPKGYPMHDIENLGVAGKLVRAAVFVLSGGRKLRDMVPGDPAFDRGLKAVEYGERLTDIEVRPLPKWARRYQGTWGGAPRIKPDLHGVGVKGPWAGNDARFNNPRQWMRGLRHASEESPTIRARIAAKKAGTRRRTAKSRVPIRRR